MDRERDIVMGFCIGVIIALLLTMAVVWANTHRLQQIEKKIKEVKPQVYEYHYYEQATKRGLK